MTSLMERNIKISFPDAVSIEKFDDESTHGLSHCMKAVDFIVELKNEILFIEIKDPHAATPEHKYDADKFIRQFLSGQKDRGLYYKYRDTFLYQWSLGKTNKPVYYLVLFAVETLTEAELNTRTDELKRKLPVEGPQTRSWKRNFVAGCLVLNINLWNKHLAKYPASRVQV